MYGGGCIVLAVTSAAVLRGSLPGLYLEVLAKTAPTVLEYDIMARPNRAGDEQKSIASNVL